MRKGADDDTGCMRGFTEAYRSWAFWRELWGPAGPGGPGRGAWAWSRGGRTSGRRRRFKPRSPLRSAPNAAARWSVKSKPPSYNVSGSTLPLVVWSRVGKGTGGGYCGCAGMDRSDAVGVTGWPKRDLARSFSGRGWLLQFSAGSVSVGDEPVETEHAERSHSLSDCLSAPEAIPSYARGRNSGLPREHSSNRPNQPHATHPTLPTPQAGSKGRKGRKEGRLGRGS